MQGLFLQVTESKILIYSFKLKNERERERERLRNVTQIGLISTS